MPRSKPSSVEEYIKASPKMAQEKLQEMRSILKEVAPDAKELIKWGSPVFEEKRILFAYNAFKNHLNFMPTRSTLENFKGELKDYKTGIDTIQFPYDKPLPKNLIKEIATYRVKEVNEGALWMHQNEK